MNRQENISYLMELLIFANRMQHDTTGKNWGNFHDVALNRLGRLMDAHDPRDQKHWMEMSTLSPVLVETIAMLIDAMGRGDISGSVVLSRHLEDKKKVGLSFENDEDLVAFNMFLRMRTYEINDRMGIPP